VFRDLKDKLRLAQARTMFELQELLRGGSSETNSRPLELYELEERVLLSATPVAVVAEAVNVTPTDDFAPLTPSESSSAVEVTASVGDTSPSAQPADDSEVASEDQQTREVVFIDTSVDNYQQLVDDIINNEDPDRQFELVLLNQSSDGVDRISESLAKFDGVDAIHIVSHGTEGAVKLGNVWLNSDNMSGYAGEIAQWSNSLTSSADILFYGCDLAGSDAGRALAESVATLSGADVAASTDDTGHAIFGGDWDLEFRVGAIETDVAVTDELQNAWGHVLNVTVDSTSTGTTPSFAASDTVSHTTSGSDRLMLVGISFGQDKGDVVSSVTYNGTSLSLVGAQDNSAGLASRNLVSRRTRYWYARRRRKLLRNKSYRCDDWRHDL